MSEGKCSCGRCRYASGYWWASNGANAFMGMLPGEVRFCPKCGDRLLPGGVAEPRLETLLENLRERRQHFSLGSFPAGYLVMFMEGFPDLSPPVYVEKPLSAVLAALAALEETGSVERPKAFLPPKDGEPSGWGQAVIDSLAAPEGEKSDAD